MPDFPFVGGGGITREEAIEAVVGDLSPDAVPRRDSTEVKLVDSSMSNPARTAPVPGASDRMVRSDTEYDCPGSEGGGLVPGPVVAIRDYAGKAGVQDRRNSTQAVIIDAQFDVNGSFTPEWLQTGSEFNFALQPLQDQRQDVTTLFFQAANQQAFEVLQSRANLITESGDNPSESQLVQVIVKDASNRTIADQIYFVPQGSEGNPVTVNAPFGTSAIIPPAPELFNISFQSVDPITRQPDSRLFRIRGSNVGAGGSFVPYFESFGQKVVRRAVGVEAADGFMFSTQIRIRDTSWDAITPAFSWKNVTQDMIGVRLAAFANNQNRDFQVQVINAETFEVYFDDTFTPGTSDTTTQDLGARVNDFPDPQVFPFVKLRVRARKMLTGRGTRLDITSLVFDYNFRKTRRPAT